MTDELLTSGEFADRSGLSIKALRLYDRIGLLRPAEVEPGNGNRRYHEGQLYAARLIALLRRLDMPLVRIAPILEAGAPDAADLLDRYWATVEERLGRQRELAGRLVASLAGRDPAPVGGWEVGRREVGSQTVLTEQRHVRASELIWIRAATARLLKTATAHGGPIGPRFVIFHGPVLEDREGPVEVCVPVDAGRVDATVVATRVEPAHHEAYIVVPPGHFEPPQILSVYDAVRAWVRTTGRRVAGPPREVYGTEDGACEVALPYC